MEISPMETRYDVYFAGQVLEGHDPHAVRAKLAKLFNADENTLDRLFSGKRQSVKRDCDEATAAKYQQAMQRAGAQAIVSPVDAKPATDDQASAASKIAALAAADTTSFAQSQPNQATAAEATEAADTEVVEEGLNLAPPETDVLREHERAAPVERDIDTSGLEVDQTAERLSQTPPAPPPAPDTSHLSSAEVGEAIPNLPVQTEAVEPDIEGITLAPAETDLSDCAPPPARAPNLDLSSMEIAPAGSDVIEERYRKMEQSVAPSTEHISLEE